MTGAAIIAYGMVNSVGLNARASCAAIRCGITGFTETSFMFDGEWILGGQVPLEESWTGRARLVEMAASAIGECLESVEGAAAEEIPLLLCVAERDRPGRQDGLDNRLFNEIQERLDLRFHANSAIIRDGRVGGVKAMEHARKLLSEGSAHCMVAGVDSLLAGATLRACRDKRWLLTAENSDGFIPGEAAAAVMLGPTSPKEQLNLLGIGYGEEPAWLDSEKPLRGEGLAEAITAVMAETSMGSESMDYRICDANGLQYWFKEAALALAKSIRPVKKEFDVWHPADCIGEVGAAAVPTALIVATAAYAKGYCPGPGVLCHFGSEGSQRAALLLAP